MSAAREYTLKVRIRRLLIALHRVWTMKTLPAGDKSPAETEDMLVRELALAREEMTRLQNDEEWW